MGRFFFNIRRYRAMRYLLTLFWFPLVGMAQPNQLSASGYTGIGVVPVATTLTQGSLVIANDYTIPGARLTTGASTQVGLGVQEGLEIVGRLASNDSKCNMFVLGQCAPNTIRDFSGSIKYSFQNQWLKDKGTHLAVGATDIGGAATYFRSYYTVATKDFDHLQVSLGAAQAKTDTAPLRGGFALISYSPEKNVKLSLQRVGPASWAQVAYTTQLTEGGVQAWVNMNTQVGSNQVTNKNWLGWGVSYPIGNENSSKADSVGISAKAGSETVVMEPIGLPELGETFKKYGFYATNAYQKTDGSYVFLLNNNSYQWNDLDALGVGVGLISRALIGEKNNKFKLILKKNGINFVAVESNASCIKDWYQGGVPCADLRISSLINKSLESNGPALSEIAEPLLTAGFVQFRPEIVLTPSVVSAIGSEFGSFDADLGVNINSILPLWSGASIEENRLRPLGVGTSDFERGGPFYYSRIKPATTRKFFNQTISLPEANSALRLSFGTLFSTLDGHQVESMSQSADGRHRLSLVQGHFKDKLSIYALPKDYYLTTYRYAWDSAMSRVSEITSGKFFNGDRGFNLSQRYWYGDTEVSLYFRRSRKSEDVPLVSFAGIQVSLPISFRFSKGFNNISIRGGNQWSYTVESRVLEKNNIITTGYGSVPNTGSSLVQSFNRDRNSVRYFESGLWRMKESYLEFEKTQIP